MNKFLDEMDLSYRRVRMSKVEKSDIGNDKFITALNRIADKAFKDTYEEVDYVLEHNRFLKTEESNYTFSPLESLFFHEFITSINKQYYNERKQAYDVPISILNGKTELDIMHILEKYCVKFIKDKGYSKVLLMIEEDEKKQSVV